MLGVGKKQHTGGKAETPRYQQKTRRSGEDTHTTPQPGPGADCDADDVRAGLPVAAGNARGCMPVDLGQLSADV